MFALDFTTDTRPTSRERAVMADLARAYKLRLQTDGDVEFRVVTNNPVRLFFFNRALDRLEK